MSISTAFSRDLHWLENLNHWSGEWVGGRGEERARGKTLNFVDRLCSQSFTTQEIT